jgi:chromosomal replication initiator protein
MGQYSLMDRDDEIRLRAAWDIVLRQLATDVPPAWLERFLRPLQPINLQEGIVTFAVPGRFVQEWVRERYLKKLTDMLSDELGENVKVELQSEPQEKAPTTAVQASVSLTTASDESSFKPFEKYRFDTFVVGQSNRLAYAGSKAVASDPGMKYNPLFIYGQSGLGKTHLLHSIAREIQARHPRYPLVYISAQQFAEDFVHALQSGRIEAFRRAQRNVGVWLVDDIQFVAGKDKTQEEVFHTFNYLHSLGKQIVLSSDRPPRDLYLMDERLRSRFEAGLVADIQPPDTETRCAILLSKAKAEAVDLETSVAMYLAEHVPGNIRILEGALTRLVVQSSVNSVPITQDLAAQMVEQHYRTGILRKPGFGQIVDAVSKHFKIASDEIKGVKRNAPIVHARHVAVFLTRELTGDSWKHIGSMFGDRDHTSMMHGYQKINEMMHQDKDLRATVKMLMRNLYPDA